MKKLLVWTILILLLATATVYAATEFVSTIKAAGGDYSSLASWVAAQQCDLTSSQTKVFSSTKTGTIVDGATVTVTDMAATVVHATATQVLFKNIRTWLTGTVTFTNASAAVTGSGTAFNTELAVNDYIWLNADKVWARVSSIASATSLTLTAVYSGTGGTGTAYELNGSLLNSETLSVDGSNYLVLTSDSDSAITSAECYPMTDNPVIIDGFTTSATNYVRIYAASGYQHQGKWTTNCYNITSPATDSGDDHCIAINDNYVRVEGIQLKHQWNQHWGAAIQIGHGNWQLSDGTIIIDRVFADGGYSGWGRKGIAPGGNQTNMKVYVTNSIFYGFGTFSLSSGIYIGNYTFTFYVVNCTVDRSTNGIYVADVASTVLVKNFIASRVTTGLVYAGAQKYDAASDYVTSTDTGPSVFITHFYQGNPAFVDAASLDFHLASGDTIAKGHGVDTTAVTTIDVDGERRIGITTCDIGADQLSETTEVRRTIRSSQTISSIARASGVVTVTLSATYPNSNLKAGQTIVISGVKDSSFNGAFVIASVTDQTHFTYNQTYYPMDASLSGASVSGAAACGDYATLTAWQVAFGGVDYARSGATAGDLVTAQRIATAECYNDWGSSGLATALLIDTWTTDSTRYVKIYTPASERHNGTVAGNGFTLSYNSGTYIYIKANYTVIDGIKFKGSSSVVYCSCICLYTAVGAQIKNNLIYNWGGANANSAIIGSSSSTAYDAAKIYNNIIIGDGTAHGRTYYGIEIGNYYLNDYIYNNTVYRFNGDVYQGGIYAGGDATHLRHYVKNNLCYNNTSNRDFVNMAYIISAEGDYNFSKDDTAPGAHSIHGDSSSKYPYFVSTTAGAEDLHIQYTSSAVGAGVDLSGTFTTDIDGATRLATMWDIGADQAPIQIYRSVGPANTTALATGSASNTLTINAATGAVTFSADLPTNVGVGDVIQYDDNGIATPDQLSFIHGRTSSTVFTVRKADGTLPTATSLNQNWAVYRAYTSLFNAEAGIENTGIGTTAAVPLTFRNFDDWTAGGNAATDDVGKDLAAANQQWNIACYNDAVDTAYFRLIDWTTGARNYVKIYTPVSTSEVGVSQRHTGTTGTGYKRAVVGNSPLQIRVQYTRIEGLEIDNSANIDYYCVDVHPLVTTEASVSYCLLHGGVAAGVGIYCSNAKLYAFNNIIYDVLYGIRHDSNSVYVYAYNNTIADVGYGFFVGTGATNKFVKNCIVDTPATEAYRGAFNSASDYNISSTTDITGGAHDKASTSTTFVNRSGDNFHLATNDTAATGAGADLSADANLAFSDDIDTGLRWAPWCIGADQSAMSVATGVTTGNWNTAGTWASTIVPTQTQDVIIAAGKTITFDKNDSASSPTCGTITVSGTLVIDTTTAANRTMVVNGDIIVKSGGVLRIRSNSDTNYSTTIKFNCATNTQYGLIVESGGTLDIQGTSKHDPDVVITALTQDSSHNAYIYCKDGSKTKIKFADISYMGKSSTESEYTFGIHCISIDSSSGSEYFYVEGCKIHNGYVGISMNTTSNSVIFDNAIYSNANYGIWNWYGTSTTLGNVFSFNQIYNNSGYGIRITETGGYHRINNNIIRANTRGIFFEGAITFSPYTCVYNNTIDANTSDGIRVMAGGQTIAIKNNIITNQVNAIGGLGISDNSTGAVIDRNLFYGNTANGSTGTNAITASNPNYVSTDSANVNFMSVAVGSAALGAGCRLDTSVAETHTNIGGRLGYVYNTTQTKKFNSLQLCNDDATYYPVAGNTVTTYTVDLKTDTIHANGATNTNLAPFYAALTCATAGTITAADQHIGQYVYMTSGANKGKYYLIVDSVDATPDTITVLVDDSVNDLTYISTTRFNAEDGFTIVDRIYNELAGDSYVLKFNKPGTAVSPITWNTSGTVIVDARNIANKGPNGTAGNTSTNGYTISVDTTANASYNIFNGFIIRGGYTAGFGNASDASAGIILNNSKLCYNNGIGAKYQPDILDNCEIFSNSYGTSGLTGTIVSNIAYKNNGYGLYGGQYCAVIGNKVFANSVINTNAGIYLYNMGSVYGTITGNTVFCEGYKGISNGDSNYNNIVNNTIVKTVTEGIVSSSGRTNIVVKNNLVAYAGSGVYYGIVLPVGTGNVSDFNYFYSNGLSGTRHVTGVTEGANSIPATNVAGTDPAFRQLWTGTLTAGEAALSSTTKIYDDPGTAKAVNSLVGYAIRVTIGANSYWAGITSNTAHCYYISPALGAAPATGTTFYITDFSVPGIIEPAIDAVSTPLGQGARADGSTESRTVNMGAIRDFVKNTNAAGTADDRIYNSMQSAHDDSNATYGCSAGDTITTYAVDEVSAGTISAATNNGATTILSITEETISVDDKYIGYYLYIYAGANRGYYYLITDSATASPDTITIYSGYVTGFNAGDKFKIVDRVYDQDGGVDQSANLYLTKDGTAALPITWNTSGTVIVDAKLLRNYGIYGNGMNYNTVQGFVCEHGNLNGIYLNSSSNNTLTSNNSYSNNSRGINLSSSSNNILSTNNCYSNNSNGIFLSSSSSNTLSTNNCYSNNSDGICLYSSSNNNTLSANNSYSNNSRGIYLTSNSNNTLSANTYYSNSGSGIYLTGSSNNNTLYNNTSIRNSETGVYLASSSLNNIVRNNLSAYNTTYGIYADGTSGPTTTNGYNDLYSNGTAPSTGITEGTGTLTTTAPDFYAYYTPTYSSGGALGATTIVLTTSGWVANQYAGYVLWAVNGATNYFRRIEYNTATASSTSNVGIYGTFPAAMSGYTFKVIDWSTQAPELLGAGCFVYNGTGITAGTGPADATPVTTNTNIASERGYVKNITDGAEFNFPQAANDAAGCNAGDTITLYSVNYKSGTIGATITDMGPYIEVQVGDSDLSADGAYVGSYMYNSTTGKSVLIINSDADYTGSSDKVMLLTDATTGWNAGDSFVITDRIYNRKDYASANFSLTKNGAGSGQWVSWVDSGTVVLDAESLLTYNVYAGGSLNFVRLKDTIKFLNCTNYNPADSTSVLGGLGITEHSAGYFMWGDSDSPTFTGILAVTGVGADSVSLAWSAATDAHWAALGHYEIWYGTVLADVQGRAGTASEWDNADDVNLLMISTAATAITGLTPGLTYYFKIWAIDNAGNESTLVYTSAKTNNKPFGGYSADNVLPAAQCSQAVDGSGVVTISFRVKDTDLNACTLKTFKYSVDGGSTFSVPANGDASTALSSGWANNSGSNYASAADWTGTVYSFTLNTKSGQMPGLNGVDQNDAQAQFVVNDGIDDSVSPAVSASFRVDDLDPSLSTWDLNMNTGVLILHFSETVKKSTLAVGGITLQNAGTASASTYTLTDSASASSDGQDIVITLSTADLNAIKANVDIAKSSANSWLIITTAVIKDLFGNSVIAITNGAAKQVSSYTADTTAPGLNSWSLNMHTHQLSLVFNESMDASTLDTTKITLQNAASPESSYTLTGNSTSVSADGITVVIDLFNTDFNAIVEKSPALAVSAQTSYLTMTAGAINDMAGNASGAVSAKIVTDAGGIYTANTVAAANFKITTTAGAAMEAGATKVIIIKAYDASNYLTPAYTGDKTLVFSGASASPESNPPVKDYVPKAKNKSNTNIDFASGTVLTFTNAAASSTTLTLFREETALISASDTVSSPNVTTASADRLSIAVSQAPFATGRHLAFSQQPSATGTINVALARQPIVAVRDAYGNQTDNTYSITIYDTIYADYYTDGPGTMSAAANPVTAVDGQANFSGVKYNNVYSGNPVYIYASSSEAGTAFSSGITFSTANTTTVGVSASPVANFNITPTNDTLAEKFAVLKFKITDAGGDLNPTLIDRIQVAVAGTGANASTDIAWAGLYNGATQVAQATGGAITNSLIIFGSAPDAGSDAGLVSVADAASTEWTVYIYMKNSKLTAAEGQTYTFDIDETKIGVDTGVSSQMTSDSGAITAVTGTIVVSVSHLEIVDQTTGNASITLNAGATDELQARATDANKNVDKDYTGLHSLLFTGLNNIGTNRPKIETTIIGSGTYITINFANGVSATDGVTLLVYKAETQNLSVAEQSQSYSVFTLSVTVNSLSASSISKTAGDSQAGAVSKQLPVALTAAVLDTYGNPVANQDVTFTISDPVNSAKLSNNAATQVVATNPSGQAATYLTLGSVGAPTVYTVTANYSGGTPVSFTETAVEASALNIVEGPNQTQAVTTTLLTALKVKLAGVGNVAIPDETISFAILSVPTGASGQQLTGGLTTYSIATDSNGFASTILKLGDKIGDYVVRASYGVLSADFTAAATAASPYRITLSGPSSVTAGSVSTVFTTVIKDIHGNMVNAGTASVFLLSSTSGTGVFYSDSQGTTVITNVQMGSAENTATFYYKDTAAGIPTITIARTSGVVLTVGSATAAPTIIPTGLSYFRVSGAVTVLTAGASRTITVTGYDQYGNVKTNLSAVNIVFSGANSSPSPANTSSTCMNSSNADIAFGSDTLLSFTNGIATSAMKLYKAESVAIKATSSAITTSEANDLEFIVQHAAPNHLKFSVNIPTPAGGFKAGTVFPLGVLHAVDLYSNLCDGANSGTVYNGSKAVNWTLSGTANSPDGASTDSYTTTVDFTAGASTTTLTTTLYRAQTTTITAAASDLSGTNTASNSITLASGPINKLTFNTQPSITATTNIVLSQQPVVAVADQYGNPVLSASEQINLSASTTTGSYTAVTNGTLSAASLSAVVSNGLAIFSGVKYSYPEEIYLRASATSGGVNDIYSYKITASTAMDLTTVKITDGLSDTVSSVANTSADKTNVFSFKVTDAGTDGYGASFKRITVNRSSSDTTSDWTNYISGAYLTDGTIQFTGAVEANKIYFGTGSSAIYTISDGQNKTYTLSVYLKSSLPVGADGKVLGFSMDANTDISCDLTASRFSAVDAVEDTASVAVTATEFKITGGATVVTGEASNIIITAIDSNRNIDKDYVGYKALVFSGANDSPLGNHPTCANYGGAAKNFTEITDIEFTAGVNSSVVTMKLYKSEIAYIKAAQGSISTSSVNHLAVTVSAGSVSRLAWATQPEVKIVANAPWKTFVISVTDAYGNTTSSIADITVTPTGGTTTAGSTVTVTASAGLAVFNNFAVTCSSYPGSVTLNGSGVGISQDTGASNAVTVVEQYSVTVNVKDSLTNAHLTEVTLQILNASGVAVYGPTTANSPFTTNLSYGTYTFDITKPKYVDVSMEQVAGVAADGIDGVYDNSITWDISMTSLEEATADYQVKSSFVYDEDNEDLAIRLWLERRGKLVINDAARLNILGTAVIEIFDDASGAWFNTVTLIGPVNPLVEGVYKRVVDNVLTAGGLLGVTPFVAGKTYYAKCKINYGGAAGNARTYEGGTTFTISITQKLSKEIIGKLGVGTGETLVDKLSAKVVAEGLTTRDAVGVAQSTLTSAVSNAQSTLTTAVSTAQSTLTSAVSTAQTAISDVVKSEILNSENSIRGGQTLTVRFRSYTGLSPKVDVYDANNNLRVNKVSMTEIGTTGIYELNVKFLSAWGYGDYTVVCTETSKSVMDAFTLTVLRTDIEQVSGQVSAILGATSGITGLKGVADTLNSQFSVIETALSKVGKDMVKEVKDAASSATALESVFTQLSKVAKEIKSLTGSSGINLDKLYKVSAEKKEDMVYLKNKTQQLKAAMEVNQKMVDNIANKPVTQTWYEYR